MKENLLELKQRIASLPFFASPFYLKNRQLIIPASVLVIAILISSIVTVPQFLKLFQTFKNIEELNQRKAFFEQKVATLEGIDLGLYRKNLDTALIALPVDKDIPGVTGELLVALSSSGMSLDGINFSSPSTEIGKIAEYSLRIEVSGNEADLKNFLDRIKVTPRIIKLGAIEISQTKSKRLNATINFVTLYQSLPENIGSVDEAVPELTPQDSQALADIEAKVKALPQVPTESGGAVPVEGKLDPFSP